MKKTARSVQMTNDVSSNERQQATYALKIFGATAKLLESASTYLNKLKNSLEKNESTTPESLFSTRVALYRFRDTLIDNFNKFKFAAFQCVKAMRTFSTDTQSIKLMKSFITSVDELQSIVNEFKDLFNNLKDKDIVKNLVDGMNDIQKKCEEINGLITERVTTHIQSDILATTWVDSVGQELQVNLEAKKPLLVELYNSREKQLNDNLKNKRQ